jgi:hypothetical protein
MKILRYVVMAVLILGISGISHAAGFSWNLQDPPPPPLSGFIPITQTGAPILFDFVDCSFMGGGITYKGCAEFQNQTNDTLTNFQFTFENSPALGGLTPNCVSDSFAVVTCGLVGSEYVIDFDCAPGTVCGIVPQGVFNLYEDALPGSQFPDVTVVPTAATPEPSSIWLALSGMGSLGYLVRRRRRASSR